MKFILALSFLIVSSIASANSIVCDVIDSGEIMLTASKDLDENGDCFLEIGKYDQYSFYTVVREKIIYGVGVGIPSDELNKSNNDGASISVTSSAGSTINVVCNIKD